MFEDNGHMPLHSPGTGADNQPEYICFINIFGHLLRDFFH